MILTSHAEHEAMKEYGYNETHFKVLVVSEAFKPKVSTNTNHFSLNLLCRCPCKDTEWFIPFRRRIQEWFTRYQYCD